LSICGDAVAVLGSGQPEAEDRFADLLEQAAARRSSAASARGLLLGGGFGGGKSHLLTHFGHLATSAGFVASTVVISKETPLHDPAKTFRAAIDGAMVASGRTALVSFCMPDFAGLGLAGLQGFFDKIYVGVDGYLQLVELEPHDHRLRRLGLDSAGRPYR
jgi:hypothetical protein